MRNIVATVLVPTHEHGELLNLSVRSALQQTVEDIEVFVVCDGATEDTLKAAEGLAEADERVRLFVYGKGPRHGEIHRHQALQEASGDIVCYLADDDLWLPNHLAAMAGLLESADFAHAYPIGFLADGQLYSWPGHFRIPETSGAMHDGHNFFPLSCAAHTLELYRRLPYGWRTSPADTPTDLYMWQQIVSVDGVRLASGNSPTVLHFSSRLRANETLEERFDEMERWRAAAATRDFTADLERRIREHLTVERARSANDLRRVKVELADAEKALAEAANDLHTLDLERRSLVEQLNQARQNLGRLNAELHNATARVTEAEERSEEGAVRARFLEMRLQRLEAQLARIERSRWWRLRSALLRIPGVAWLARTAGRSRSC